MFLYLHELICVCLLLNDRGGEENIELSFILRVSVLTETDLTK